MNIRYIVEIGILMFIIVVGLSLRIYTQKRLKDIDGFGGVHKKSDDGKNIIEDINNDISIK